MAEFDPAAGVDYSWVVEYAKGWYAESVAQFAAGDAKAASLIQVVGAATGLGTVGSLATSAKSDSPGWPLLFLIPSFGCAVWSIRLALKARRSLRSYDPPTVTSAAAFAEHAYNADASIKPSAAQAMMAAYHQLAATYNTVAANARLALVDRALTWTVRAVALLSLPLGAAFVAKQLPQPVAAPPAASAPGPAAR